MNKTLSHNRFGSLKSLNFLIPTVKLIERRSIWNKKIIIMRHFLQIASTLVVLLIGTTNANPPLQLEEQPKFPYKNHNGLGLFENTEYRLNDSFIPSHYDLELLVILDNDPDIGEQFTAPGKVTIDFKPSEDTSDITLHSFLVRINIFSIQVTNVAQPSEVITVSRVTNNTENTVQLLTISTNTVLDANQTYQLYIEFVAPISQDILSGLYLSTYTDPATGELKRLAATQMESIHARKLFPCFDEPNLKATFDVTIIRKDNYTALANGNLLSTVADTTRPGWSVDKFNTTVPMSTYLFAMVVSDFTYVESDLSLWNKPVRVYAEPHLIARGGGDYAANVSAKILQFYDDYFQAPYPLTKMDTASIPQFSAGAMENYGLNLYRESLLIYFPGETTEASRNSITSVLAHELGHQNFGDLVTMNWWRQIWLNEGFATYVANLGVDAVHPEFRAREDTVPGQLQGSMVTDVSSGSHPIQNNVEDSNPDGHNGGITYDKGGSVNRMTEKFLTEETFQKGLRYYLQGLKYQAAHSDDLFRFLDIAAAADNRLPTGVTVKQILDTWTLQRGHPLVRVSAAGTNSVTIHQEKYAHLDDNTTNWYVPVTVVTQDKPTLVNNVPEVWLSETSTSYEHDTSKWIMINQDATGYYRTLYDTPLTNLIKDQLDSNASVISPLSRSQLLDDYFTMAYRGNASIQTALNLTAYMAQEDHFAVYSTVFKHLQKPYTFFSTTFGSLVAFMNYMLPRIEPALEKVGVEQSPDHIGMAAIHRARLLDWACSMGSQACSDYSKKLFTEWKSNPSVNPITVDTRSIMHCAIVNFGTDDEFDFTFEQYKEAVASGNGMKSTLLNALACASDQTKLQNLLEKALNTTSWLDRSDATAVFQRVAMNAYFGINLVLRFLDERLPEIISTIGSGSPNPIASIVSTFSSYMNQQRELDLLEQFINDNSAVLEPVNGSLQGSLNTIRSNIQWMTDFGNDIGTWLNNLN